MPTPLLRAWSVLGTSRRWCALLACAWLAACGGGGGGDAGGGGGPPATLSSDVYPLNPGDTRTWRITAGGPPGATRTERLGERTSVGGRSVLAARDTTGAIDYLDGSGGAVTSVPGPGSNVLSAAAGPVDLIRYGQTPGETVVLYERTVSVDLDADGRADSVDLRVESTFTGRETVTTPAGTFSDAARVRTVARSTLRVAGVPGSISSVFTSDDWYASGVGPVKSSSTTVTDGQPPVTETEELIAYGVGARRSESVAPTLASVTPAADGLASPSVRPVLVFSEPLDVLTLDGATGLSFVDAAGTAVRADRSVSADGRQITFTPQAALPDGRYELRLGAGLSDLAGNPLVATVRAFTVDTTGPRVVASQPAAGSADAPLTGTIRLTYNEPIIAAPGSTVTLQLSLFPSPDAVLLPAVISGNELVATITTPLLHNREYLVSNGSPLTDAAGNPIPAASASVRFRTEPGPLSRPAALWTGHVVSTVAQGDLNGDGRSDLVFVGQVVGTTEREVGVRLQQADGRYAPPTVIRRLSSFYACEPTSLVIADLDGNGRADIALSACFTPLTVLMQQADGSFVVETPAVDVVAPALAALDLDGDGRLVLVTGAATEFRFLRRAAGGIWSVVQTQPAATPALVDWRLADLNGDGRPDLVWVRAAADNLSYELAWALRSGSGFGATQSVSLVGESRNRPALTVADVTGDGRPDILLATRMGVFGRLALYPQDAVGGFGFPRSWVSALYPTALRVADVDGDGRADVVMAHANGNGLGVYLGSNDALLQEERVFESSYAADGLAEPLAVLDLDADGRPDVVVGSDVLSGRPFTGPWPLAADEPGGRSQALAITARPQGSRFMRLPLCAPCAAVPRQ